jgi:hypothetical protein
MLKWFVEKIVRPIWIVNEYGEMGIRIFGVNCYYYKWETPLIYINNPGVDERIPKWTIARKREFGECVISRYKEHPDFRTGEWK